MSIGTIELITIKQEMERSYLNYAMSVIVSRALPDVRDGLKPVHRRILYAMHQIGLSSRSRYTKSAKVVGEVLGKYHPHGDAPVYDAMVRLAQSFSMRYPLIDGQGNFGSIDGDPPAAMRYTECRMATVSDEMLADIDKETVPFTSNFDDTLTEPDYLPAKLPNLLIMGSEGIAVGMATKIPPHNLTEIIDAILFMIKGGKIRKEEETGKEFFTSEATVEELMQFVKGPDFPTEGTIYGHADIAQMYESGRGKIVIRGKAEIEDIGNGKSAIIITELPYQVNKAHLVAKIAELAKDKKLQGISDLRDESDRRGIRVYIELKRDAKPKSTLNQLYKQTSLQTTFPGNFVALVDGTPRTLGLKTILEEYIKHRQVVIRKRSEFELAKARARAHILEGFKIAIAHIDEVIETIKKSKDSDEAKKNLMSKFELSEIQSTAILDMQLRKLAALEVQKLEEEYQMVKETIKYLEDLLSHEEKILIVITEELAYLKEKYGDNRKTKVIKARIGEFSEEDLIPNEKVIVTLTKTGYIKRLPFSTFKTQQRGGKGVIGMATKENDEIGQLISTETHDDLLFFTNLGKVYKVKVWDLQDSARTSKGQAVINLINIESDERVTAILPFSAQKQTDTHLFMATIKGTVKKTKVSDFANIRTNGIIAIKLTSGDQLTWVKPTSGTDEALLISHDGKCIRFAEGEVRPTARDTMGVRGITLKPDDYLVSMDIITADMKVGDFITIMANGVGKKTKVAQFPSQKRSGQGVKVAEVTTKTGKVIVAQFVPPECDTVILTSQKGQVVNLPIKSVPTLSRSTQGVILMRFAKPGDSIAAATCLDKKTAEHDES